MGQKAKATLCVLVAATLWGCMSLFIRALSSMGFSPFEIVAGRMAVATIILFVFVVVTDRAKLRIRLRDIWIFAFTGLVGMTLYNVLYIACINLSEASVAIVLLYTAPIFTMILGALVFRESVTVRKVVALVLTFAGCVLVAGLVGGVRMTPLALAAGLAGGFFYGTYSIAGRFGLERYDTLTVTFYNFLFCFLGCLALSDVGSMALVVQANPSALLWFLGIGIFCAILPYMAYNWGLARMEASRATILATFEVLVAGTLGIVAYGDSAGPSKLAGMALVLAAVIVLNSRSDLRTTA